MESDLRGRFRRSPGGLPAHPALGQRVSWEAQGTDVLQGSGVLPRPPTSSGPSLGIYKDSLDLLSEKYNLDSKYLKGSWCPM